MRKVQPYNPFPCPHWKSWQKGHLPQHLTTPTHIPVKEETLKEVLANHLLKVDYPKGWKAPRLATSNGRGDLGDHIHVFTTGMEDMTTRKDIWRHMFCHTLINDAIAWCRILTLGSINTYDGLEKAFRAAFSHRVRERREDGDLLNIFQRKRERETLRYFLT